MANSVSICSENVRFPYRRIRKKDIDRWLRAVCRAAFPKGATVTLIVCDNAAIRIINKKYRKKDRPTDVITFAYDESPFPARGTQETSGDIYLSLERAAENAAEYGVTLADEIQRLLVHGVLHMAGYDHERSVAEERRMRKREEEVLRGLRVR
ncbi:MAG TPA: rRNA maturation RNase YbeY [Spirochaetota bacterium]|nr:rRNA maturation RNase YbeY [Spirochaetota bacterium]HOS39272.1 rRNA maturation RNase YbeY [Spirochaetota bacterium]HPI23533.1 rRNA maturation RNase YbeY [Spirochaetota bacterium]